MLEEALDDVPNISVATYNQLTVDFAREMGAQVIVRGLRVISDFELEFQMALTNKKLAPEIEFVCLMTSQDYAFLSASTVKEIAMLGDVWMAWCPPRRRGHAGQVRRDQEQTARPGQAGLLAGLNHGVASLAYLHWSVRRDLPEGRS